MVSGPRALRHRIAFIRENLPTEEAAAVTKILEKGAETPWRKGRALEIQSLLLPKFSQSFIERLPLSMQAECAAPDLTYGQYLSSFNSYYCSAAVNDWVFHERSDFPAFANRALRAGFVVFPATGPFTFRDINVRVLSGILPIEIPLAPAKADNQELGIYGFIRHDIDHDRAILSEFEKFSLGRHPFFAASIQLLRLTSGYSRVERAALASTTTRSDIFDQVMLGMLRELHLTAARGRDGKLGKHGLQPIVSQLPAESHANPTSIEYKLGLNMIAWNRPGDIEFPQGTTASEIIERCRLVHQVMFRGRS